MSTFWKELFKAIHEGYWISIEYHNQQDKTTNYWIRIKDINPLNRTLLVEGMHLRMYSLKELKLFIDSITDAKVIEGTYAPVNETLIKDISDNPEKYKSIFSNVANLKILNYLADCNRLDQNPYETKFALVDHVDDEILENQTLNLSEEQFKQIVRGFESKKKKSQTYNTLQFSQFGMNVLSLHTNRGKYILAYQPLRLDVTKRQLSAHGDIVICSEFNIDGSKQSIRKFLDADDIPLLTNFKQNAEKIRNAIAGNNPNVRIDDMPYLIQVARDSLVNLDTEFGGIIEMYSANSVTTPIQAFFGELTAHSRRTKSYPFALINKHVNMDQLLAMNHAMRYPVSYVQGPPGTGKTMTIMNTIISAFFNNRTVLFASSNNHPIDELVNKLKNIKYQNRIIPFPVIRLGNMEATINSLKELKATLKIIQNIAIYESTLDKNQKERTAKAKSLTELLDKYETKLDLLERRDAIDQLLRNNNRHKYGVTKEYDYCKNSIYKTYLACDRVSDEVLLSHHYRCDPRIIGFNNRKYYNNKLKMDGAKKDDKPLVYIDVKDNESSTKNTAPKEVQEIIHYIQTTPNKSIGIITPFVKQKELIQQELELNHIHNVDCGTGHSVLSLVSRQNQV